MISKKSLCVFCNEREATTQDHIPPKCLYPVHLRKSTNLITVPSCYNCNNEMSDDEEHFRNIIVIGGPRNIVTDELFKKVLRGLRRAKGNYKFTELFSSIQKFKSKIHKGKKQEQYIVYPDKDMAFCRVMSKIGRGLFYYHMQRPLSLNYHIETRKLEFTVPYYLWGASDCYHCNQQIFRYGYISIENGKGWFWIINFLKTRTFTLTMLPA